MSAHGSSCHCIATYFQATIRGNSDRGERSVRGRAGSRARQRAVPVGFTFKGLPQHFVTTDARAIFSAWMQSAVASDILRTKTFKASIAVRVRVFPMADDVLSVWVMLAMAYRPEP